jgi:hypothetical protein
VWCRCRAVASLPARARRISRWVVLAGRVWIRRGYRDRDRRLRRPG